MASGALRRQAILMPEKAGALLSSFKASGAGTCHTSVQTQQKSKQ